MIGRGSWPASLRRLCWLPKAWARCSGHPNVPTSPFSKSQQIKSPKVGKWRLLKGETLKPRAMAELWSAVGHANMWTKAKESLTCTSRFSKDSSHWTETAGWNSRSKTGQGPEQSLENRFPRHTEVTSTPPSTRAISGRKTGRHFEKLSIYSKEAIWSPT